MVGRNIQEALAVLSGVQVLAPARAELDLASYSSVLDYLKQHQPDFIVHAAGRVGGIQANMAHPVEFLVENLDIGRNVIMAAREAGIKRLLNMASSCRLQSTICRLRESTSPMGACSKAMPLDLYC